MRTIDKLEKKRLQAQRDLDSTKSPLKRNELGQFATPPELARDIARFAHGLWKGRREGVHFLDPAIGTGSFFAALSREFPRRMIASAKGVEIDPKFAKTASDIWGQVGLEVVVGDFTKLPPLLPENQVNLILTNPPYVRHHHLTSSDKVRLQEILARRSGYALSGLAGLYCYFLLLADEWLAEDGLGLWLIPSEFMDVNYGSTLRQYLTERVTLLRVHRFDPANVQFDDALVSSAIVVFLKQTPPINHEAVFSLGGSLMAPAMERTIPIREIAGGQRWGGLPQRNGGGTERSASSLRLSDLFSIKRGIATGANDFFIIERNLANELSLPVEFLRPILPNPRGLKGPIIEADSDGWPLVEEQLVLIDCRLPEFQVKDDHPSLWSYLMRGEQAGIRGRYLIKQREPWYSQESRPRPPFLCTYMGRGTNGVKPFRFFWNRSNATAHNVYLLLYPKGEMKRLLVEDPSLEEGVFRFLERISGSDLVWEGRVYGGGLHKLEPSELGRISADGLFEGIDPSRLPPREMQLPL